MVPVGKSWSGSPVTQHKPTAADKSGQSTWRGLHPERAREREGVETHRGGDRERELEKWRLKSGSYSQSLDFLTQNENKD